MLLTDTHCHLTSDVLYKNLRQVLQRARRAGIAKIITIGTDVSDSRQAVALADLFNGVYASIGIHPHQADQVQPTDWNALRELRHHPKVVAWGEIGLDYHYDFSDPTRQRIVLSRQLELASRAQLPVVIHCREAVTDTVGLLKQHGFENRKVVFHCFTGTTQEAEIILNHGWWLSFTGIVTFKNSIELQTIAQNYPLDKLMLETDAPYLTPEPHRRVKPNEPAFLPHTAKFIARLKSMEMNEIADRSSANAKQFFGI